MADFVSDVGIEKLLAIQKVPGSGTSVLMGNKVVEILRESEGVSEGWLGRFDTTIAKAGVNSGAITFIQETFDQLLLFLACRHHV